MSTRPVVAHVTTIDATLRFLLLNQMKAIQRDGYTVVGVSAPGPYVADLEREGIAHYAVPRLNRGTNPAADVVSVWDLVRLFRRERFAIVHTHMPKTGVVGRLAARLAGVPCIVNTIHGPYGLDGHPAVRWFFLTLERLAARASTFELCQSREIYEMFLRLGIFHPARSAHLGNGINLAYFSPEAVDQAVVARLRAELEIPPGAPVIGTVGRVVLDKGYREFFAAAERVRAVRPDAAFVVAGQFEERDSVPEDLLRRARAGGVRFLGLRQDIREVYALMDVFALATYREGFPRAAMEAAAMARAMVLTDIRGCREVVTHGRNGWLVPARQAGPLADAILALLEEPSLRGRFGEESRRRAAQEFDERRVFARVIGVYGELLAGRRVSTDQTVGAAGASRRQ